MNSTQAVVRTGYHRADVHRRLAAQQYVAEITDERLDIYVLNLTFDVVKSASPSRFADLLPVCGLIAGPHKFFGIDECFNQNRSIAITILPVIC